MTPTPVRVGDADDPRVTELRDLTDAQARAHTEAEFGCFVVEGLLSLEACVRSVHPLRSVLVSESKLDRVLPLLDGSGASLYVGSQALLEDITGFPIHRGVVASAGRLPLPDPGPLVARAHRIAVVEGVNDHENLGALFRNAAAFGLDAVLLDQTSADPLYRRSVRVSVGHVLHVPWTRIDDVSAVDGFQRVALTPAGDVRVDDLGPADRRAWLLGAEGPGLSSEALAAADVRARIAMAPGVDSLNVATAAAVAFAADARWRDLS